MEPLGQPPIVRGAPFSCGPAAIGAGLGALAALPLLVYLRGFTVDDALIPARYAAHLAEGLGYRFNAFGPVTDGVTPLGFPYLLAPFAGAGPLAALRAARTLGAASWFGAAALLGARTATIGGAPRRYAALLLVALSAPLAAWAVSGLETGLVIALATMAAALPTEGAGALAGAAAGGAVAGLRPEMIAWALVMAFGRASAMSSRRHRALAWTLSVAPWCAVVALRTAIFGRPVPLAVLSKPSDLMHGLTYVLPALAFTGAPLAAMGFFVWRHLTVWPRTLAIAALAHVAVVALAGGDWMPLARLVTPILPALVLVVAHQLAAPVKPLAALARLIVACAAELMLLALRGPAASRVLADRLALIDAAREPLRGAAHVATLDVGWVGAATGAEILDLAGATDREIAALPGGHTSKAVSGALVTERGVDRLVFQLGPGTGVESDDSRRYARRTEQMLAADLLTTRGFHVVWQSPADLPVRYEILAPPR